MKPSATTAHSHEMSSRPQADTSWQSRSLAACITGIVQLRGENVTFLEEPSELGDTRAVMIESSSREALELVESRETPTILWCRRHRPAR